MDAEHSQVGDGEGTAAQLFGLELVLSGSSSDLLDLVGDLLEALQVKGLDGRSHKAVVGLNSEAHVYVLVLSDEVTHPGAVGLGHADGGKSGGLHDEVVDRDLGGGVLVEFGSQLEEVVHLHLHGYVVVRDVLLGVRKPIRNHLSNLGVLEVFEGRRNQSAVRGRD